MDRFGSQLGETDSAGWIFDYYETVASIIRRRACSPAAQGIARAGARAVVVVSTCTEHTDPAGGVLAAALTAFMHLQFYLYIINAQGWLPLEIFELKQFFPPLWSLKKINLHEEPNPQNSQSKPEVTRNKVVQIWFRHRIEATSSCKAQICIPTTHLLAFNSRVHGTESNVH